MLPVNIFSIYSNLSGVKIDGTTSLKEVLVDTTNQIEAMRNKKA